ncbi:MAG: hypothetical protein AMS17_13000 [Spirochaetes bacterium DG_61]|jgi:D-3-phosphoglycerate dehydrogenase|nr:MAG: hypothetical protein AMS17_13000 [Spirochaetes bacterium DG_61]
MMRLVLVSSRSFGSAVSIGEEILRREGFTIRRVKPEKRPLDAFKMQSIVSSEKPDVIVCGAEPINEAVLKASQKLRLVMKHGVGIDNIDLESAASLKIPVAIAPGTNTEAVADFTVAVMLVLLRSICQASNSTKRGEWKRYIGNELGKLTVGIVGTGRIGISVMERLHGFRTRILAYDIFHNEELESKYNLKYVDLDELLKRSDIVTLHVPLTDGTSRMIGHKQLEIMKKGAYLINLARGGLIDEKALYEHLKSKRIAGAAIDVFSTEPPQKSPLLKLDNVLATPHLAAYTYEAMERMDRLCGEIIVNFFKGYKAKVSPYMV